MPNGTAQPNGSTEAEPKLTLREAAEAAWDEVVENAPDDDDEAASAEPVDDGGQPRDAKGRFAARSPAEEPGEAEGEEPTQPREESTAPQPDGQTQPQPGVAAEAPANWTAEQRSMFAKLPDEAKAFVLERHGAMEGDYQRRVQSLVPATQFVQQLAPVFNDPVIAGSLQQNGLSPSQAIQEWAAMHRRAVGPDIQDRMLLLSQLAQRMGINLNPAASGVNPPTGQRPPGLTPQELADPAIRWFADNLGQTSNAVVALRNELNSMRQNEANRQNVEAFRVTQWGINNFADEVGQDGKRLRPYFDDPQVMQVMIDLYRANPQRDLAETYNSAIWMVPHVRTAMQQAETARAQAQRDASRAAQAARSNVRGRTSPVTAPNGADQEPRGLRATLEATADDLGIE
jgi:hypothetical protein